MNSDVQVVQDQVIVKLGGKIYIDKATLIRAKLFPYIENGYTLFIFHFDEVEYIDSSGLGALVAIQKRVLNNGGRVVIQGLNEELKALFELTRLDNIFDIR